jgi:protein TonB
MYGAMRERAPNRPMQIVGLGVSALATVAAANLLMSGFGNFVGAFTPAPSTTLTTLTPDKRTEPPPLAEVEDTAIESPFKSTTPLPLPDENFKAPEPDKTITVAGGDESRGGDPEATIPPPKAAIRLAPRLRSEEKPPYPASEIRAHNEGNTGLGLCVDARGRVTSASLVKSSGHPKLDEAALKWVKDVRFSPGTVDGAPQAVCGHTVVYEWRLEDAR